MSRASKSSIGTSRASVALGAALGAITLAHDAFADERVECAAAYEQTQRLQQKSELFSALEAAERCARPTCPALLKDECARWKTEIRTKIPEIVVRVRSIDGCTRTATKIESSGPTRKDTSSEAILLNPGSQTIKVTDPVGGKVQTTEINFAPGERRDIDVDFGAPDAVCGGRPKVAPPPPTQPNLPLILGATGGALVLGGAALGVVGAMKRQDLDSCKPSCAPDRVDEVRPFFIAGDIVGGLGLLAIGAAVVTYFAFERTPPAQSNTRVIVLGPSGVGGVF